MEFGGLPPLCYASGLPGHGACGVQTGRDKPRPMKARASSRTPNFPSVHFGCAATEQAQPITSIAIFDAFCPAKASKIVLDKKTRRNRA
jgi:hypothetical protein